jgi:hypothetical protein
MAFTREKMMSSLFLLAILLISLLFSAFQEGMSKTSSYPYTKPEPQIAIEPTTNQ